jgi:hypothetical protein
LGYHPIPTTTTTATTDAGQRTIGKKCKGYWKTKSYKEKKEPCEKYCKNKNINRNKDFIVGIGWYPNEKSKNCYCYIDKAALDEVGEEKDECLILK